MPIGRPAAKHATSARRAQQSGRPGALSGLRIAVRALFLIFEEYKLSGTESVFGGGFPAPPHEDWVKGERGGHRSLQPFRAFCTWRGNTVGRRYQTRGMKNSCAVVYELGPTIDHRGQSIHSDRRFTFPGS
jgi:hypothetical protein